MEPIYCHKSDIPLSVSCFNKVFCYWQVHVSFTNTMSVTVESGFKCISSFSYIVKLAWAPEQVYHPFPIACKKVFDVKYCVRGWMLKGTTFLHEFAVCAS